MNNDHLHRVSQDSNGSRQRAALRGDINISDINIKIVKILIMILNLN